MAYTSIPVYTDKIDTQAQANIGRLFNFNVLEIFLAEDTDDNARWEATAVNMITGELTRVRSSKSLDDAIEKLYILMSKEYGNAL